MKTSTDFDRQAAAWLAEGPTELNDRVLDAALHEVHLTAQRRRWAVPWRAPTMRLHWSGAALIATVVLAGILGTASLGILGPASSQRPPGTGTPSPVPTSGVDTAGWTPFTSNAFGFDARYPQGWEATRAAPVAAPASVTPPDTMDSFRDTRGSHGSLLGWSVLVPAGMSADDWVAAYLAAVTDASGGEVCYSAREAWEPIQIDGRAGWLYHGCGSWVESAVVADGRAYVFAAAVIGGSSASDAALARENLLAFLGTVRLHPEAVARPSPTLAPIDTGDWILYVSAHNWLGTLFPRDWTAVDADHDWTMAKDAAWPNTATDTFVSPDGKVVVTAWSTLNPDLLTLDAWIAEYCPLATAPCTDLVGRAKPIVADPDVRKPGVRIVFEDSVQAFFLDGDRIYGIAIRNGEFDPAVAPYGGATHLLEAFALSMCFDCASPVGSTPRPG